MSTREHPSRREDQARDASKNTTSGWITPRSENLALTFSLGLVPGE